MKERGAAKWRLFVAVETDEATRRILEEKINQLSLCDEGKIKWVPASHIHLTLSFLGSVQQEKREEIQRILDEVAGEFPEFHLELERGGAFPDERRGRIFLVHLKGEVEILKKMADDLHRRLAQVGYQKEERKFVPHLTLGRLREGQEAAPAWVVNELLKWHPAKIVPFHVTQVVLFRSELRALGPVYTAVYSARLGARKQ